ncbi:cystathionine beta-synthase [Actinomycetospora sp. NBRC 106375]|uniref:PLP-dependent cysteine synthase family protein n=1 Tax=Actinomycetospora sp. NBRC 106375 TaxID=3032207 RepID=UPI0024A5CD2C|nr:pyridoxal-phosphate dependent enzyme [Actinomycetospora sp. NBRC 106375]GLZ47431.1 cystathionine beta-synthase [Actinomycetospora sp. NBRC 106375]
MSGSVHESVLDAIGATPLIRLRRVTEGLAPRVYVKAEWQNAGGSVKDRAALWMVRAAERSGALRPGGVIVEGTSGNTGIGLALVGGYLGYRTVIVIPDTTAVEKVATLRAYGAEVVPTPAGLAREDPRHVMNLAARLAGEIPGGWLADQYDNPANPQAHRDTTAPEIWEQTGGAVTCFVAGIGTGGTLSGTGTALKEKGPVRVVGVDPMTSAYGGGDGSPYYVEAIGHYRHPDTVEDPWPANWDRAVADEVVRVDDRTTMLTARRLAREEGLLLGGSSATAVAAALRVARDLGPDDVVVVVAPDSGRAYLSKYFDDGWLRRLGFLTEPGPDAPSPLVDELSIAPLPVVRASWTVGRARTELGASSAPAPVARDREGPPAPSEILGAVTAADLDGRPEDTPVRDLARPAPPSVGAGESLPSARGTLGDAAAAWVIRDGRVVGLVTRDVLAPAG